MECLIDHIVLNVEDDKMMINFYSQVLQLETERLQEYSEKKVPFPSVRLNRHTIIDLFPKDMWQVNTSLEPCHYRLNHICFSLDKEEWGGLITRLQENNIDIQEGPVKRWGARGTGTSIYFRDPEQNLIEARYYEEHDSANMCLLGT